MLDQRGRLLVAALGLAGLPRPSYDRALWALRSYLDSWSGIGRIAVGMVRQGYDLQLTRYDERGWRATFYTTGMEHSLTSATGIRWEPTPWHATRRAAWARPGMGWYAVAMETNEISEHLFRVYAFVRDQGRWVTAHEITDGANVASRTHFASRKPGSLTRLKSSLVIATASP